MITKIYNTKINQTQTLKDFLVEHNFTGEYLIAFEYIVSTVPEELLRDKNGSLSKPFIALLVILSYFVGSSREDILKLAYAKDISALYDITFRNLKKEYDKYYSADQIGDISLNDFILSKENFHDYPEAYLLCLLAIEHGYRPKDIRDSIDEYIKELLQNRGVVEMLELSKAYRGSLTAIKEVLINEMVTKNLNAPDNLKIDEPEPHKIDITNFDIPGGLIEKDSLLYRHLMRIKPAGTKIVLPEKNIFANLVSGVYGATLFSGIGDTSSQGVILKENITPRPTSSEVRTAPTVIIEQALAPFTYVADIFITQTNPEDSIVDYRLTVTFPTTLEWERTEEDLDFVDEFKYDEEYTGTHLQGCGFGSIELNRIPATDYSVGDVIRGRLDKIGGSPCPTWAYFKLVAIPKPKVVLEQQVEVPAATLYSANGEIVTFTNKYNVPIELKVEPIVIKRKFEPSMKRDLSGAYTVTLDANPDGSNPPKYVQTKSADFDASGDYTGTAEYIILPADKPDGYQIVNPNVKGVATDGDYLTSCENMFRGNPSSYLDLDYLDTSNVTTMQSMFNGSQATILDLSNLDTSNVTNMRFMFQDSQATTLDLSSFDTSNVTDMTQMFHRSQATTLDLSKFDTSNVTSMSYMFSGSQAATLDLSNFDTSNVTNMNSMFRNSQATELDLSSFDTSNVYNMSGMFRGSQATILDLSNLDTSNVTNMRFMFQDSQATTLDLSSFDTSNVTDMNFMFQGSQATTGYARTQTDADRFNSSSNKPSTLTFVVKPPA